MFSGILEAILAIRSLGASSSPASGFIQTCAYPGAHLTGNTLGMYCLNENINNFGYNYSRMPLNNCVGNNAGSLVGFSLGNYSHSCLYCNVTFPSTVSLNCWCYAMNGKLQSTSLDLNNFIMNNDGNMECYGHEGNKTWAEPS